MAAQRDNRLQARIGEEVKRETAAMKAIAVGTLTFLPATFVSVSTSSRLRRPALLIFRSSKSIFSTSFFDYQPGHDDSKEEFTMSSKFWLYWVLAAPLSIVMVLAWLLWEKQIVKRHTRISPPY